MKQAAPNTVPMFGVPHGGDVSFVLQSLAIENPGVPAPVLNLSDTIGDYW